jgi:type I restriction enzyme, S subunit
MKTITVPSSWLLRDGMRLDSGPYISGALEARMILEKLRVRKDPLSLLTTGHQGGIYNGPQFKRNYVESSQYGVPFLTGGDVLQTDLSQLPLLSRRDALSNKLRFLRISPGMTLISCSGSIGRMTYARDDMDGIWSSQDVMKIVPDPVKVLPGYLYAYISSKFGVPLVVGGTYGAIIQHIEPHHIAHIPVPRISPNIESDAHKLVQEAADARTLAAKKRAEAMKSFIRHFRLSDLSTAPISINRAIFDISARELRRMDATYFSPICREAAIELRSCSRLTHKLGAVARVFTPGIFKRQHVDDPHYGYAYFSGSELFQYDAEPRGYLSRRASNITEYLVERDWLLIQDAGQLAGLIGRVVRVTPFVAGGVVSNHLLRVVADNKVDTAFLFIVLSSPQGYRAITRNAFGTSIPQLDPTHIGAIDIPWPAESERIRLAEPVLEAWELEDFATEAIRKAIRLIESTIEEGAS